MAGRARQRRRQRSAAPTPLPLSPGQWVALVLGAAWLALVASPWAADPERRATVVCVAGLSLLMLYAGQLGLRHLGYRGDRWVWPLTAGLLGLGMLLQTRLGGLTGGDWARPYAWAYPLAPLVFLAAFGLRGRGLLWLQRYHVLAAIGAVALMYWLVFRHGSVFRGALFGPLRTTPSEALKLLLVVYLAGYLARRLEMGFRGILGARLLGEGLLFVALWCVPQAMFVIQRDLGVMVLFGLVLIVMFFAATGRPAYLLLGAAVSGLAAALLSGWFPHVQARGEAWLRPFQDPGGVGWQPLQALFSLRSGWVDGVGLGAGLPTSVPVVESDFVYAAIAEELGLWGAGAVLLVYTALLGRGWLAADQAARPFESLLAAGFTALLASQVFVNVAGVVRAMPITGLTLPLLSRGGSSLLASAAMLGLIAAVSHGTSEEPGGRGEREP